MSIQSNSSTQQPSPHLISWYPGFEVKFTENKEELNQVKKLRMRQKNTYQSDSVESELTFNLN